MSSFLIHCALPFGVCSEGPCVCDDGGITGYTGYTGPNGFSSNTGATGPTGPSGSSISTAYGEFYGGVGQNVYLSSLNTYVGVTGMTGGITSNISYSNPPSTFTVSQTGNYMINCQIDGSADRSSVDISASLYVNGSAVTKIGCSTHYQQTNDDQAMMMVGIVALTAGDTVTVYMAQTTGVTTTTFQTHDFHFTMFKI